MSDTQTNIIHFDPEHQLYRAPGLIDLQVNGINGVDFNDLSLTEEGVLNATRYLLSRGTTTFFPTVITNSDENILRLFQILTRACERYPLVGRAVGGFHLEGPFISPKDGAKGAHDAQYIKPPDWELMERFQQAAAGKIKIVTLAPEWEESEDFIEKCRESNILVSMGHSLAGSAQIKNAVTAGLTLSTHLGNGIPLMLKRHPNLIWDQLANDGLYAMMIADGHHLPDTFMKVVKKAKGEKVILVSDATQFAGMPPGEYQTHIGGSVVLNAGNRLSMKGSEGYLAGAAKDLLQGVETLVDHKLETLEDAWKMASVYVINMLKETFPEFEKIKDKVEFQIEEGNRIIVKKVFKNGKVVE